MGIQGSHPLIQCHISSLIVHMYVSAAPVLLLHAILALSRVGRNYVDAKFGYWAETFYGYE